MESISASPPPTLAPTRCTLADQINAANTDAPSGLCPAGNGADIISLDSDFSLNAKLPAITSEITIQGNGHTINGAGKQRIFDVAGGDLTINHLRLTGGKALEDGGAIWINRHSIVNINRSEISDNAAGRNGGAIWIKYDSQLNISASTLSGNSAGYNGGAIYSTKGYLAPVEYITADFVRVSNSRSRFATLSVEDTVFSDNRAAESGGAIYHKSGVLKLRNSHFSKNAAELWGGAIKSSGSFDISGTVFTENSAGFQGGANRVSYGEPSNLADSVFTHNSAGKSGGAIDSHMSALHIQKSKFYDNNADGRVCDIHADRLFGMVEDSIRSGQVTFHRETKVVRR